MMSLLWARARVERLLFRHSGRAVQAITGKYCTVQDCTAARLLRDGQEKRFDHCVRVLRSTSSLQGMHSCETASRRAGKTL